MLFHRIAILMVRSLVEGIHDILNAFPSKNGITDTISPATRINEKSNMAFQRKMIVFGSYAWVYIFTNTTDKPRAVPVTALSEPNNTGEHYFMSLHTGKKIH